MEVLFKGSKIQTGNRVKIPEAIMDTLGIESGTRIIVKFDPEKREIIIKESKEKK